MPLSSIDHSVLAASFLAQHIVDVMGRPYALFCLLALALGCTLFSNVLLESDLAGPSNNHALTNASMHQAHRPAALESPHLMQTKDSTPHCANPDHLRDPCAFVTEFCNFSTILFNPVTLYYCRLKQDRPYSTAQSLTVFFLLMIPLLFVLFLILYFSANDHLTPALSLIARWMKLSPTVAGVTLLAFGNGAPDFFTSLAGTESVENVQLIVGGAVGSGLFVTLFVFGLIVLKVTSIPAKEASDRAKSVAGGGRPTGLSASSAPAILRMASLAAPESQVPALEAVDLDGQDRRSASRQTITSPKTSLAPEPPLSLHLAPIEQSQPWDPERPNAPVSQEPDKTGNEDSADTDRAAAIFRDVALSPALSSQRCQSPTKHVLLSAHGMESKIQSFVSIEKIDSRVASAFSGPFATTPSKETTSDDEESRGTLSEQHVIAKSSAPTTNRSSSLYLQSGRQLSALALSLQSAVSLANKSVRHVSMTRLSTFSFTKHVLLYIYAVGQLLFIKMRHRIYLALPIIAISLYLLNIGSVVLVEIIRALRAKVQHHTRDKSSSSSQEQPAAISTVTDERRALEPTSRSSTAAEQHNPRTASPCAILHLVWLEWKSQLAVEAAFYRKALIVLFTPVHLLVVLTIPPLYLTAEDRMEEPVSLPEAASGEPAPQGLFYSERLRLVLNPWFSLGLVIHFNSWWQSDLGSGFPAWALYLILACALSLVLYCTTSYTRKPVYRPLLVFLAFVICLLWIYGISREIVTAFESFGVLIPELSSSLLGMTLLAWGNSSGDLIIDLAIAATSLTASGPSMGSFGGFETAVTGVFCGPIQNVLLSLSISFLRMLFVDASVVTESELLYFDPVLQFGFVVLLSTLCLSLVLICLVWKTRRIPRWYGWTLVLIYLVVFLPAAVLGGMGAIPAWNVSTRG